MVTIEKVSLSLEERPVLVDVSWTVRPGTISALGGPNGAGKSSLLRVISGELPPTGGRVLYGDRDLRLIDRQARALVRAYVPQELARPLGFLVIDVVKMTSPFRGPPSDSAALEALLAVGLSDAVETPAERLSGGELQRLFIARALCQLRAFESERLVRFQADQIEKETVSQQSFLSRKGLREINRRDLRQFAQSLARQQRIRPLKRSGGEFVGRSHQVENGLEGRVLLLDEPFAHQDPAWQVSLSETLRSLAERGLTIVVSIHDLGLICRLADEALLLRRGAVISGGPLREALSEDHLERAFDVPFDVDWERRFAHPKARVRSG